MPTESFDVVIAGAGFAGAATAYHLVGRGIRSVLIVEREAIPGVHASGRNAGLAFTAIADRFEAALAAEGLRFLVDPPSDFCSAPLLQQRGSLLLGGVAEKGQLESGQHSAAAAGLPCELIDAADAVCRVPVLEGAPFAAACWNPHDGVVDIHALLQGYLAGARAAGVRVDYRRWVRAVQTTGGRVSAVETEQGLVSTPCLVNAAGAWAGEVGVMAGVGARTLAPRRRHLFQTVVDIEIDPDWPYVWHNDIDIYFRREGNGLLMSPCDVTPHPPREPVIDEAAQLLLAEKLPRAFPRLAAARVASAWACLRTFARDERFVIGRDPDVDGLVWVAALGGHGMTTSYGVGRLGAAAVLGESNKTLDYFSPSRLS